MVKTRTASNYVFPLEEFQARQERVRAAMAERGLDAVLISAPENIYYLAGLNHMGYFAFQMLILPVKGKPVLVTRAMERATVRDQVREIIHAGYSDADSRPSGAVREAVAGGDPPESARPADKHLLSPDEPRQDGGTRPGVASSAAIQTTVAVLKEAGLAEAKLGIEMGSTFLPPAIYVGIDRGLPKANLSDVSGIVEDQRLVQSPLEVEYTRKAAVVSDSMMLASVAAAGPGMWVQDVMAAIYDAMFRRGGTYPGFVPLVRTRDTLDHEHGTWNNIRLGGRDKLFIELSGCLRRYHAPIGRFIHIGGAPKKAGWVQAICRKALEKGVGVMGPEVPARDVYPAWHSVLEENGLAQYNRHHCGYAVGIGFPPSWSGGGVPVGLRPTSPIILKEGMVFHFLSWLLGADGGDAFISDTVVVTGSGAQLLTTANRDVLAR